MATSDQALSTMNTIAAQYTDAANAGVDPSALDAIQVQLAAASRDYQAALARENATARTGLAVKPANKFTALFQNKLFLFGLIGIGGFILYKSRK